MARHHIEVERRWVIPSQDYGDVHYHFLESRFKPRYRRDIEDIYYDTKDLRLYTHGRLLRARISRWVDEQDVRFPIKVIYKGRPSPCDVIPGYQRYDSSIGEARPESDTLDFYALNDFHSWESDLKKRGFFPELAFTRRRVSMEKHIEYEGMSWIARTEGDIIFAYEKDGKIGLRADDEQGRTRFDKRIALEIRPFLRDNVATRKKLLEELASELGLDAYPTDTVSFRDVFETDAKRRGIL